MISKYQGIITNHIYTTLTKYPTFLETSTLQEFLGLIPNLLKLFFAVFQMLVYKAVVV